MTDIRKIWTGKGQLPRNTLRSLRDTSAFRVGLDEDEPEGAEQAGQEEEVDE